MSTANRKYKDSVFVDLFSEDEKAKENFCYLCYNKIKVGVAMSNTKKKFTDSVFVDRQRLYIRVQSLTSSFEQSSKHRICVEPPPSMAVI